MNPSIFLLSSAVLLPLSTESEGCPTWLIIVVIVIILYSSDQQSQNKNKTSDKSKPDYLKTPTTYSSPSPTSYRRYVEDVSPPYDDEIDEILSERDEIDWQESDQNNISKQTEPYKATTSQFSQRTLPVSLALKPVQVRSLDERYQEVLSKNLKSNWQSFDYIIRNNHIDYLYHFTDMSNVESIFKHGGLYSWKSCLEREIRIACPGGNSLSRGLDIRKNLNDYIHLGFNKKHPMLYVAEEEKRIRKAKILRIDTSVIFWDSTLFSDKNATSNQARIGGTINDFRCINFGIACGSTWNGPDEKSAFQAEVLVRSHIPIEYISF